MSNKRIFVAFAIEDEGTKKMFTGQAKNSKVPYEFVDMSVKKAWDSAWKTNCKIRIKGCDAMIVLVSKHTKKADGQLWEIECGRTEGLEQLGIYIGGAGILDKPDSMKGVTCKTWTWDNVRDFIEGL